MRQTGKLYASQYPCTAERDHLLLVRIICVVDSHATVISSSDGS